MFQKFPFLSFFLSRNRTWSYMYKLLEQMRNQKLQGTPYDKRCQRRIYKRSDQPKNIYKKTKIDCKANATRNFRDTNTRRTDKGKKYMS